MTSQISRLRRLSMGDRRSVGAVLGADADGGGTRTVELDPRTRALVQVAALVALDGPSAAFDETIAVALAAGATPDDIVDTMIAVGPTIGSALLVSSAPKLAMALGYDVAADLEELDVPETP
jgi:4-carboxymuconolactone decarboxylase